MRTFLLTLMVVACCALAPQAQAFTSLIRLPADSGFADKDFVDSAIMPVSHCAASCCDVGCDAAPGCDGLPSATCDCCKCRAAMFGNWAGLKPCLAEHGIIASMRLSQFYQGVTSGGREQADRYGGKLDYRFTFLTEQTGLWKGGTLLMHAETAFGETSLADAGAFALTNTNLLWPLAGEQITAISGFLYLQALTEKWSLAAGKINVLDFWTMFYPNAGYGQEGFMNMNSLAAGLPWLRFINLSINGAGILALEGLTPQGFVFAFDLNNSSTTTGLNNLFDNGAGVLAAWRFFTEVGGKPGSHLVVGGYANRAYTSLDETSWFIVPGQGVVAGEETGAWAVGHYYDQTLWADRCDQNRKLQLFTGWGISDGNPSFSRWGGLVSLEKFGTFRGRDKDRMGIAYFYNELSNDFRNLVSPVVRLDAVQGGEVYYNAAITNSFHLTGDFQAVANGRESNKTALILALRAVIDL